MSVLSRNYYRKKLHNLLSRADDEAFFLMIWTTRAFQTGRQANAAHMFSFPREAITKDLMSKFAFHSWKLETLINEVLAVEKIKPANNGFSWHLNCRSYSTIARVNNCLTSLENAEDGLTLQRINVIQEMHRLLQRQIEWQREPLSWSQIYRSAFIYGGGASKAYFLGKNGFPLDDFTLCCLAARAMFEQNPIIIPQGSLDELQLSEASLSNAYRLLSIKHPEARRLAKRLRSGAEHTSYKKSFLRQFPCIDFGIDRNRLCAPLPELVTLRGTTGLFYDLVSDDGCVRNEISRLFEAYCLSLLQKMLPSQKVIGSFKYSSPAKPKDTPDILINYDSLSSIVVECKATRMSFDARYSETPMTSAARGYDEIAKAVYQIWRFVSHRRRGLVENDKSPIRNNISVGIVLTLDTWLTNGQHYY